MAASPGRRGRCGAGRRMGLRVVPRPGRGLGEEGAGAPRGLGSATACRFVTRHPAAPCRLNGHTGSSRWVRERNMRIANCPRVPRGLPGPTMQVRNRNKYRKHLPRGRTK